MPRDVRAERDTREQADAWSRHLARQAESENKFDSKNARVEEDGFDAASKTKMAAKEAKRSRFGFAGFGGFAGGCDSSSDDEAGPKRRVSIGGTYGSGTDSDSDDPLSKRLGGRSRNAVTGMAADLRTATELPDGVEVIGGEGVFEEQEDGNKALMIPEGAHVKISMPGMSPWMLEDDGRLHRYSLLMAVRLDRLPSAALPIFNGSAPPTTGEPVDSVYLYKNGGVGALGQMGVREAAVRAAPRCSLSLPLLSPTRRWWHPWPRHRARLRL